MNKRQFELLCIHLDSIVELLAELKVDIMRLKYPLSDSPPKKRVDKEREGEGEGGKIHLKSQQPT